MHADRYGPLSFSVLRINKFNRYPKCTYTPFHQPRQWTGRMVGPFAAGIQVQSNLKIPINGDNRTDLLLYIILSPAQQTQ